MGNSKGFRRSEPEKGTKNPNTYTSIIDHNIASIKKDVGKMKDDLLSDRKQ